MKINEKKGKGLSLILGDDLDFKAENLQQNSEQAILINIDSLVLNPYFEVFPEEKEIENMANAIRENGQLTPILVRKKEDKYEVVTGEKRYYACKLLGLQSIKVVVCDLKDNEVQDIYLYDLLKKNKLNLVSEARLYQGLIKNKGINQTELANRLGKSRASISNILRILKLNKKALRLINKYQLSLGQVKPLIGLENSNIESLIERINKEKLSSRDVEKIAFAEKNKNKGLSLINEKEKHLNTILNCKSKIRGKKVEFTFKTKKELDDFISNLK